MGPEQTLGEKRVRVDFNVNNDETVGQIKVKSAELIDLIETLRGDGSVIISGEKARLIALAQTEIENGAMWAVKAATA